MEKVEKLVAKVSPASSERVIALINKYGVGFEMTEAIRDRLRRAGADAKVLAAVEQAASTYTRQKKEEEQQKAKAAEEKRKIEAAKRKEEEQRQAEVAQRQAQQDEARRKAQEEAKQRQSGEMVEVPAGEFFMGCNETVDTECYDDEKLGWPQVHVAAFKIDRTEVTVAQYARCVDAGACSSDGLTMPFWDGKEQPGAWACNWGKDGRGNHPINCVTWQQAQAHCAWAGKRLPIEAEWEKAARGTDGRKYPWGNRGYGAAGLVANIADETAKRSQPNSEVARGYDDGFYETTPVGSFPAGASPYGALDMIGNVWEWTYDWYDTAHKYRSRRGGSWGNQPRNARTSLRNGLDPASRSGSVGFRCAQ